MEPCLFIFIISSLLLVGASKYIRYHRDSESAAKLPPGPWSLPIIGNIHNLVGKNPHRALRDLAVRYGPLIKLRFGEIDLVVATSREAAAEIMRTHDHNFSFRPELLTANTLLYGGTDILFSSYGVYWRQLRKICVVELLSAHRVRSFRPIRDEEIGRLIARVSAASAAGAVTDLGMELSALSSGIVGKVVFGRWCPQLQELLPFSSRGFEVISGFSVADLFPSVPFLADLTGMRKNLEDIHRNVDRIMDDIIRDHTTGKKQQEVEGEEEEGDDLMDVLLRVKNQEELPFPLTMDNIKAVITDIVFAGTETASSVLHWAMTELVRNPAVMAKAQAEVRGFGGANLGEEDMQEELNYLGLVVKETLRLHLPLPLLSPRLCKNTCQVLGYTVPAGTRVFTNAWAIGRDPRYWGGDAESFRPERFDGQPIDFKGQNWEYIPFGAGRRICPGIGFGMASVVMPLARLLYHFDWELPDGMKPEDVDITESWGASASKKLPLRLLAHPKFPSLLPTMNCT